VIDRPETVLEMARRHVLEGEERLARQIAIVAKLERNSHTDAALATKVLEAIRLSPTVSTSWADDRQIYPIGTCILCRSHAILRHDRI